MFERYLRQEQITAIRGVILRVLGYDANVRNALLAGLPTGYRFLLPGGTAAPPIGLQLDLNQLNTTRRLVDAIVPLRVLLDNAISFAADVEEVSVLREALAEVEGISSGAAAVHVDPVDVPEVVITRNDMVPVGFLGGGVTASRAVARLLVPRFEAGVAKLVNGQPMSYRGTGWLLAPGLLMTNHHVVNAREQGEAPAADDDLRRQATATEVLFDYDSDISAGTPGTVAELVAWGADLDFAVLRLAGHDRPALALAPDAVTEVSPTSAMAVNVIQHPDGQFKRLGIRNNLVSSATPTELRYFTDTLGGSSGSPVLDDSWRVVGLHRGSTFVHGVKFQGQDVGFLNVGTQVTAILDRLRSAYAGQLPELGI